MQDKRGVTKILITAVVALLLGIIVVSIIFITKDNEPSLSQEQIDIEKSLSIDERANGIIAENVIVTDLAGNFARGKLTDSSTSIEMDFYMIKISEVWRVVEITNTAVSCERFARLGFPNVFIQDCKLSFSDAVTLSEIDSTLADFFLSSQNENLKIIGIVESIIETEDGQIVTINSGGESVQVQLNTDDRVEDGDMIVTDITPPNQNNQNEQSSQGNTQTIYNSTDTVVIDNPDEDLIDDMNPNSNIPVTDDVLEDKDNKVYKIDAPKSSAPASYFFNVTDLDDSYIDVELDGNF